MESKKYAARLMADTGKLTQREIASQLGVNQSTVSKWLQASKARLAAAQSSVEGGRNRRLAS